MHTKYPLSILLVSLAFLLGAPRLRAQSQLMYALQDMYTACLFGEDGPFSRAVALSRQSLSPGINGFIESNLAAIPRTPPNLTLEREKGQFVEVVTGFAPIYTESSATVGGGQILAGSNYSFLNFSRIRGSDLSEVSFAFEQNGGGDVVYVEMPIDMAASVFTLYGTYGITNRLDVGISLPIVSLSMESAATNFRIEGSNTGLSYLGSSSVEYSFTGDQISLNGGPPPDILAGAAAVPTRETFLSSMAVRAKYRFPVARQSTGVAAVLDLRIPTRSGDSMLGGGNFGLRFTVIGEYSSFGGFRPYLNLGSQMWDGSDSSSFTFATGFNQEITPSVFFAFDLLGELDLQPDPFLGPIDDSYGPGATLSELSLVDSSIPAFARDHTLNSALGLQVALSSGFHAYGSALFSLLQRGLQAPVVPTVGAAMHF